MKKSFTLFFLIFLIFLGACSKTEETVQPPPEAPEVPIVEDAWEVYTLTGSKVEGAVDGQAEDARFFEPSGMMASAAGEIFVADVKNHLIRAMNAQGDVRTIAGGSLGTNPYGLPQGGFADGAALESHFDEPKAIAVAGDGTIYVADSKNGAIRSIAVGGEVSTVVDGLAFPSGIALDQDGVLYVAETMKHRIIAIGADRAVTVVAGGGYTEQGEYLVGAWNDGVGKEAQFNEPMGLAFGADRMLYVADAGNQRIRAVDAAGVVTTVAGSGKDLIPGTSYIIPGFVDGSREEARFNFPKGLTVLADGSIIVADTHNHSIRLITPDGVVETIAGRGTHGYQDGGADIALFDGPMAVVAVDDAMMLVTDRWNNVIRVLERRLQHGR